MEFLGIEFFFSGKSAQLGKKEIKSNTLRVDWECRFIKLEFTLETQ